MATNPILPGFNPDPSILRIGDDYFIATSTFEYWPGIPIHHSKDLTNWTVIGHALNRRTQLDMRAVEAGGGLWAPTLRFWKGKVYMACCCVWSRSSKPIQPTGFYVVTDDIFDQSRWSDPIFFDMIGFDQDLLFDDDDRVYLSVSRFTRSSRQATGTKLIVYGSEIDIQSGRSISATKVLRLSTAKGGVSEGPHLIKRAGWYYLLTADGGTGPGHQVWITRSRNPLGPFEEPPEGINPLVFNGEDEFVRRTGHADFVEAVDGRWWAVMLAIRPQANGLAQLGRETFLSPMEWPEGGWPRINNGENISLEVKGLAPSSRSLNWQTDFRSGKLDLEWYTLRTPVHPFHFFDKKQPGLRLISNGHHFRQLECPAMLLRRQTSYQGNWSTQVSFNPESDFEEAGTAAYYSDSSFASLSLSVRNGVKVVLAKWTDHTTRTVKEESVPVPLSRTSMPVILTITASPTTYDMGYRWPQEQSSQTLVSLSSLVLDGGSAQEFEFYFTGVHFGIFNQTLDGEPCLHEAIFDWAEFSASDVRRTVVSGDRQMHHQGTGIVGYEALHHHFAEHSVHLKTSKTPESDLYERAHRSFEHTRHEVVQA